MARTKDRTLRLLALVLAVPLAMCEGGGGVTTPGNRTPAEMIPRGGDALSAPVGNPVTIPPSVRVVDVAGRPVAGVEVAFSVTLGGGSITGPVQTTDAEGIAAVGSWTLGEKPGTNQLTAVADGLDPVVMQATAHVGAPSLAVVTSSPASPAPAGSEASPVPEVRVEDEFGNPVPDVTVTFEVLEGGGTVEPTLVVTGPDGLASPTRWVLGSTAGVNRLQAVVDGVDAVRFTVETIAGSAASATEVQGDDQQGAPGETLPLGPAVKIEDALGNPVSGVDVTFTIIEGGGSVTPTVVTTDEQGVAETDSWTLGPEPGENVVEATAAGIEPVRFNATAIVGAHWDLRILEGDDQTAPAGTAVPVRPATLLLDGAGDPIEGYPIDFFVREGGGSVEPARVFTDSDGVARTSWTLGPQTGFQALRAQADGFDEVTFTATATAGEAAVIVKVAGDRQSSVTGGDVPVDPTVRVEDDAGNPVPDATVTFEPVLGGGSITGGSVVTGDDGIASVGSWTLGPAAGENRLRASTPGADPVAFTATAVEGDRFNLDVRLVGSATTSQREALERARVRWSGIIQGDLMPVQMALAADACVEGQPAMDETVDDLLIFVKFDSIDGPGKVLGSAGPCYVRSESRLPIVGVINLDSDDLEAMADQGILDAVIIHEMGHVLGIGTLWSMLELLVGEGGSDPYFVGPAALAAWDDVGGAAVYDGEPVPVANTGGAGTRDGHWREAVLDRELMTGFIDQPPNPLSLLTIASLADLGYVVDLDQADPYQVPSAVAALQAGPPLRLDEVPLPPPVVVDAWGRPVGDRR